MSLIDTTDFAVDPLAVSRSVLQKFLHVTQRAPRDYLPTQVGQVRVTTLESERVLAAGADRSAATIDRLIACALRLDQLGATTEDQSKVLPAWLMARSMPACLLLARAALRAGRSDHASVLLTQALALDSGASDAHREFGLLLWREGETAAAIDSFEAALATRRRIAFDGLRDTSDPILVAQPSDKVDIVLFGGQYYVVPQDAMLTGVRPLGAELFRLRKNALYRIGNRLMKIRSVNRVARSVWALSRRIGPSRGATAATERSIAARFIGRAGRAGWRVIVRPLIVWAIAKPVEMRAGTFMAAIELAEQHAS